MKTIVVKTQAEYNALTDFSEPTVIEIRGTARIEIKKMLKNGEIWACGSCEIVDKRPKLATK